MLDLTEIKRLHDENFTNNQVTRQKAADDRVFSRVSQWDDGLLEDSQLYYRGEFNLIRKATRQITADLRANPVQVDFSPVDDSRRDGADVIDGLYLTDDRRNSTLESYANASMEAVDCGVGGWELFTEYETKTSGERNQVIRRKPIYEANNNSFPDSNAKALDKSDAMNWSILEPFSEEGYKRLYKKLTGSERGTIERDGQNMPVSFAQPEQSYTFPWVSGSNKIFYIVRFYVKELISDTVLTLTDAFGSEIKFRESDLDKEIEDGVTFMDELLEQGYEITDEEKVERYKVTRYIASGEKILKIEEVPGQQIPVVHCYGERTFVEGEEIWEGVVRLAKDPQRLRNFMLSYLADLVSRSPRPKPIFSPEQIAGFEFMYEENGADNNFPYYLMNRKTADGEDLPPGPLAYMQGSEIPKGLVELGIETREAVKDVADAGLPNDIADPDLSGYAIEQLHARFDQQSMVYQENMKFAKRWDAEIYAGIAAVIYDAPRRVTITKPDGERSQINLMDCVMNPETGEMETVNDLTNQEFEVYAEVGPSYTSKREKTREVIGSLAEKFTALDPEMAKALNYKLLTLMDGVNLDDIRDYANKQLLISGIRDPENEEEMAFLQDIQNQPKEPSAEMVLAQAEQGKAQAQQMREQRMGQTDQVKGQNENAKVQVDAFRAQTDRMAVQIDAEEAGVNIDFTKARTINVQADTVKKLTEPFRARVRAA